MRKCFLIPVSFLIGFLINCSSEQVQQPPKDNRDEIAKELNKKLESIEIQGFAGDQTVLPENLYSNWSKKGLPVLKEVLPQVPEGYTLKVTGHADPYGGEEKANRIAEGRAKNMRSRLSKALGIEENKLGLKNYGTAKYEQKKEKSISKNRRVEFEVSRN